MRYLIDSYAWIEYLEGTREGEKVKNLIEDSQNESITNVLNVAELSNYFQ